MTKFVEKNDRNEFKGWRESLWPIHRDEIKKFLPLALIMFCILFNYTLLRTTKDTLIVGSAGASAITFLKLYCVTPAAILFVLIYAKLTTIMRRENIFYAVVTPLLVFFAAFAFIIYPNFAALHPDPEMIQTLHISYPRLSGFIDLYAYWTFSLFYVFAEIWGSAMIGLMFWQFANQVVRMSESKRFYGLFAVVGNLALMLSGFVVIFCSEHIKHHFVTKEEAWQHSIYLLMSTVVFFGIIAMILYRWMHTNVLNDNLYFDSEKTASKKKKGKLSLIKSVKMIFKSPELGLILILIVAYSMTINFVEVQWKHQLGLYAEGDSGFYNAFMGYFSTLGGAFTILFGLLGGSSLLRRVSWFSAAIITPLVITIVGVLFFSFILGKEFFDTLLQTIQSNTIMAATFLGAAIVTVAKGVKYILFDPTKEMAYIPLDEERKTKDKAVVDVIGGRIGKAGGAVTQNVLLIAFATKDVLVIIWPVLFVFSIICVAWLYAVKALSSKVESAVKK